MDLKSALTTWNRFTKTNKGSSLGTLSSRINNSPKMKRILNAFISIISFYFITRDYDSVDLIGSKLNLLNYNLDFKY